MNFGLMSYIFVSFSKHDIAFARQLCTLLQGRGFAVWMDETTQDHDQQLWPTIEANLLSAAAFLIIMSPAAQKSHRVRRELQQAVERGERQAGERVSARGAQRGSYWSARVRRCEAKADGCVWRLAGGFLHTSLAERQGQDLRYRRPDARRVGQRASGHAARSLRRAFSTRPGRSARYTGAAEVR